MAKEKIKEKKYISKITDAAASLEDAKLFLYNWNEKISIDENIQYYLENNIFSKPSRDYTWRILRAFKRRFVFGDDRDIALRLLSKSMISNEIFDCILYYHIVLEDNLLYDLVIQYLYDYNLKGIDYLSSEDIKKYIIELLENEITTETWSDKRCKSVASHVLTTLRDCHLLEGKSKKKVAPLYMPVEAFVYVAQYMSLYREVSSGSNMLSHADWKMFLLDEMLVERMFLEAHQHGLLSFQSAGNLVRIEFKYKTLSELINAITK